MLGILGGTFNPIHNGHLSIAYDVYQHLGLSVVHFVPCYTPVHKPDPIHSVTPEQRLAMLELALQNQPFAKVNRIEIERKGASYMIDTLRQLKQSTQEALVLILGTDAFNGLHQWKQAQSILDYCHIVVCQRPGERNQQTHFNSHIIQDKQQLKQQAHGYVYFYAVNPVSCSATLIRENRDNIDLLNQYLAHPVIDFIQQHNLYNKEN